VGWVDRSDRVPERCILVHLPLLVPLHSTLNDPYPSPGVVLMVLTFCESVGWVRDGLRGDVVRGNEDAMRGKDFTKWTYLMVT
jgi:hypothetical protein